MKIGEKTWFRGDEVTITSEPYTIHGGTFQDAVTETGKKVTMATKAQQAANAKAAQDAWKAQQDEFRGLR